MLEPFPLRPASVEYSAGPDSQAYVERVATWGAHVSSSVGIITADAVLVSLPIGVHRHEGSVYIDHFPGDAALENPKYVFEIERMPLRKTRRTIDEAILLTAPWHHNFYHWLIEILPRLAIVERLDDLHQLPLVVPASAPSFVRESLRVVGALDRVLFLEDGVYRFRTLHLPTRFAADASVSPIAVDWLREKIPLAAPSRPRRRIYLSRRDSLIRFVSNESEVEAVLREFGFETVVLSGRPLAEQAQLFRDAELIVGAHGAGFSHLVFCEPGATAIEIFQRGHFSPSFNRIAALRGLHYGLLVGRPDRGGIRVDVDSLREIVTRAAAARSADGPALQMGSIP